MKSSPYEKSSGLFLQLFISNRQNCKVRISKLVGKPAIRSFPIRAECPPGACNCGRDALLQNPDGDLRVLRLTREDDKQLLRRLENLSNLCDLKHIQERMQQQLGIQLSISTSPNEICSLRGITILVHEQLGDSFAIAGFCSNTRHDVRYLHIKGFGEHWNEEVKSRLAAMEAKYSTRMGAAIRHAAHYLEAQQADKKTYAHFD
jgi:hypothetical protein